MHPALFFTFLIIPALSFLSILVPLEWSWVGPTFAFGIVPVLDVMIGKDTRNPSVAQELNWKRSRMWAPPLYLYLIIHFALLITAAWRVQELPWNHTLVIAVIVGLCTGGLGITVGHELCHKKEWLPRLSADLLLASVWYQHFAVEHVRGHHLHVSTPNDPASARKGESLYRFLVRSIVGSFLHALKIDAPRVCIGVALSMGFTALASFFGAKVLVFFLLQAVVAFTLLEMVNYLEHYGLTRPELAPGKYGKVTPIHSWNSSHMVSNLLLFNLQRHSDHHALAHLPYTVLKHHDESPQLPYGYPTMVLLALIPPLWFRVMDPKLAEFEC
jgi:alkane 1-monooxygenase